MVMNCQETEHFYEKQLGHKPDMVKSTVLKEYTLDNEHPILTSVYNRNKNFKGIVYKDV